MSFTISYNIKAIDQFSAIAQKISDNAQKMDSAMRKMSKGTKVAVVSMKQMGRTSDKVIASQQANQKSTERLGYTMSRMEKAKDRVARADQRLLNAKKRLIRIENQHIKAQERSIRASKQQSLAIGQGMNRAGTLINTRLTLPLIAAGVASARFAMNFETAMVEVQKVTDKATAGQLRDSIRDMTKEIPFAHDKLAGIAADAARFGIKGTENIEAFTRSVAKMAQATDLTTDVAGTAFAKIEVQTGLSATQTENLGSAINTLSNNYATSAGEIVSSMLRASSAASTFGLSAVQIAGLSAQTNAMSESAERAGTRMRTLFNELQNPRKVEKYAKAIGMSAKQFDAMREANPAQALMSLVSAINKGGEASKNLRKIAGAESIQSLVAMGKNIHKTRAAMVMSAVAFQKNTSLQKEFKDAVDTNAAKMKIFWNRIRDIAITLGDRLLPIAEKAMRALDPMLEWMEKMDDKSFAAGMAMASFAVKMGVLLTVIGKIVALKSSFGLFMDSMGGASAGAAGFGASLRQPITRTNLLKGGIGGVVGKMGALAGAFAVGHAAGTALWDGVILPALRDSERLINNLENAAAKLKTSDIDKMSQSQLEQQKTRLETKRGKMGLWDKITGGESYETGMLESAKDLADIHVAMSRIANKKKEASEALNAMTAAGEFEGLPSVRGGGGFPGAPPQEINLVVDLRTEEGTTAEVKTVKGGKFAKVNTGKNVRD